jgi:hypothetical protein
MHSNNAPKGIPSARTAGPARKLAVHFSFGQGPKQATAKQKKWAFVSSLGATYPPAKGLFRVSHH